MGSSAPNDTESPMAFVKSARATEVSMMVGTLLAADAVSDALVFVPILGVVLSSVVGASSYFLMKSFCDVVICRLTRVAERLYNMVILREVQTFVFQDIVMEVFPEQV
mmetsp:Transcript_167230/g.537165  ORF Transcript_167230/g.537165 Transcript_167230/m.537165 type:complete len:108 (+) Transcript_167230:630-953(+)